MANKLSPVDIFYIEGHKDKMSAEALANAVGCTKRTIYNYLNKFKADMRTEEGRAAVTGVTLQPTPEIKPEAEGTIPPTPMDESRLPPAGLHNMNLAGRRKHGDGGAVTMTKELSEVGDVINKQGPGYKKADHIHVINPDK